MIRKVIKFTPELTKLVRSGVKTTTWRLFDDKDLSVGDNIELATREGDKVTPFGYAKIVEVTLRTVGTLHPIDFEGHEPVVDPLKEYQTYYGDKVTRVTEMKVLKYQIEKIF